MSSDAGISSSPNRTATHRLLYRGALSLPDSHIVLDGLTFSAKIDEEQSIFNNPLALALESMRGRPSLRFMGLVNISEVYYDLTGGITVDVHSKAVVSRLYFENTFCLAPNNSVGVKVALGDTDGPETTQIIILGKPQTSEMVLSVAHILAGPSPNPSTRIPRPDDPTPRKPPLLLQAKGRNMRRVGSMDIPPKRKNNTADGVAADLGSGVRLGLESQFKIPILPSKKGKQKQIEENVFGQTELNAGGKDNNGKRKRDDADESRSQVPESSMERENKDVIKQLVVHHMKVAGFGKSHDEFKETFQWVYRGICFALRHTMKVKEVDYANADRLTRIHVEMYIPYRKAEPG